MLTPCVRTGCIWAVVSPDVWIDCTLPGAVNRCEPFGACNHDQDDSIRACELSKLWCVGTAGIPAVRVSCVGIVGHSVWHHHSNHYDDYMHAAIRHGVDGAA
jgi:hypothetical protein